MPKIWVEACRYGRMILQNTLTVPFLEDTCLSPSALLVSLTFTRNCFSDWTRPLLNLCSRHDAFMEFLLHLVSCENFSYSSRPGRKFHLWDWSDLDESSLLPWLTLGMLYFYFHMTCQWFYLKLPGSQFFLTVSIISGSVGSICHAFFFFFHICILNGNQHSALCKINPQKCNGWRRYWTRVRRKRVTKKFPRLTSSLTADITNRSAHLFSPRPDVAWKPVPTQGSM